MFRQKLDAFASSFTRHDCVCDLSVCAIAIRPFAGGFRLFTPAESAALLNCQRLQRTD